MSYLVLARKWRPQNFEDLIGQEHVSKTLSNAITTGRVHHAFLFTGARGVGKTSAARIFAKALNCEKGLSPHPCNQCPSCLEITGGQGLDVFEIDGASNTGVDDVRELRENIRYLPSRSRYKIFIIDEVHMLSINAFNALLKTLEEPPDHAKFIFATTEPHKLPITILSRCQRFDFRKIALPKVVARLRYIVDAEKVEISDRALALVARRGEGSMRDSLSSLDQVIAFCGESVNDEDVQGLLGMVDRRLLLDIVEALVLKDSRRALAALQRADAMGISFRQLCQQLVDVFRSLVFLKVMEDPGELLDVTAEELHELAALAAHGSLADHERALTLLLRTEGQLVSSAFPRLHLEMAFVRLANMPPALEVAALLRKVEDFERLLAGPGGSAPSSRPSPPPQGVNVQPPPVPEGPPPKKVEAPPPPETGQDGWLGLVDFVRSRRPLLASVLEHGSLLSCNLPLVEVGFPEGGFPLEQVKDPDRAASLQELMGEYFAAPVTFRAIAVSPKEGKAPPSLLQEREIRETDRKKRLKEDALAHPAVQSVCKIFGGEIREIKPIDKGVV